MNDLELDGLLDSWHTPPPSPQLRTELLARFPSTRSTSVRHPFRWVLAIALIALTMTIATGQTESTGLDALIAFLQHVYNSIVDTHVQSAIMVRIRESHPKVFIDGQPSPPPVAMRGASFVIHVPGDAFYQVVLFHDDSGRWTETGAIHGNILTFQAGERQVRIVCDKNLVDADRRVYTRRLM